MRESPDGTVVDTDCLLRRAEHEISYGAKRAIEMYLPVWEQGPSDALFDKCADVHTLCEGERQKCRALMREFDMLRYPNGESVTKDRIQDEWWYADYQAMIEVMTRDILGDVEGLLRAYIADYEDIFGRKVTPQQRTRFRRWAHAVYAKHKDFEMPEECDAETH